MSDGKGNMLNNPDLFESAVAACFSFLEQDYGFTKQVTRPTHQSVFVRYENAALYVNVMFGPPAYEPEMSFGRLQVDDVPGAYSFEAGDLIQLTSCLSKISNPGLAEQIANQVAFLASCLRECGRPCLGNDSTVYIEMKARRDAAIADWHQDERNKATASQIEAAWNAKDYKAVIGICAAFDGPLSAVNVKRLAIATERA